MYRVSPFIRHFAVWLLAGVLLATLWVNLDAASYYDAVEFRIHDLNLPDWLTPMPISLTPLAVVSNGLMALVMVFVAKELWESFALEHGPMTAGSAAIPLGGAVGGMIGAAILWIAAQSIFETASEANFATGWPVPLGSDFILGYVFGRMVFGPGHPALHVLLFVTISSDILGLLLLGLANPEGSLRLFWLVLPLAASFGAWRFFGRRPDPSAPERQRRQGMRLWPYVVAGVASFVGVAAAGLPPALGLLPVLPAIPHADRSFGLFAEAESFLHDPLNRLAHILIRPVSVILFLFGLTQGGIDFGAASAATGSVLLALWIGKPCGILIGMAAIARWRQSTLPPGLALREVVLIALIGGMGLTVPILALEPALPGGGMTEAARLGLAISLAAGPAALVLGKIWRRG